MSMRTSSIRGLLILNAALLILLGIVTFAPRAEAQSRARGEYIVIGGEVPGVDGGAAYIVDTINQEMMVVAFTQTSKRLQGVGYRNLAADAASLARGQQPNR